MNLAGYMCGRDKRKYLFTQQVIKLWGSALVLVSMAMGIDSLKRALERFMKKSYSSYKLWQVKGTSIFRGFKPLKPNSRKHHHLGKASVSVP